VHEYSSKREHFGYVAVNDRTNAGLNPLAAARTPMTMSDYLTGRMIRTPLCIFDMDLPVDGADAFVLTSTARARDLPHRPVMIHATTHGLVRDNDEEQLTGLHRHGQHVAIAALRAKSDVWLEDVDVYFAYDGFTIITLAWIENIGWCGPGEAGSFLGDNWAEEQSRVLIKGRIPLNSHGGALSEGATRGSGYFREAVFQLRGEGEAGNRQVPGARVAMLNIGGFFFNSQSAILRRE
jgi:acetyl-CoA acetyltransferase